MIMDVGEGVTYLKVNKRTGVEYHNHAPMCNSAESEHRWTVNRKSATERRTAKQTPSQVLRKIQKST